MGKRKEIYFRDQLPPDPVEECPADCKYLRDLICHYLLDTGKARGCKPGKDCRRYAGRVLS